MSGIACAVAAMHTCEKQGSFIARRVHFIPASQHLRQRSKVLKGITYSGSIADGHRSSRCRGQLCQYAVQAPCSVIVHPVGCDPPAHRYTHGAVMKSSLPVCLPGCLAFLSTKLDLHILRMVAGKTIWCWDRSRHKLESSTKTLHRRKFGVCDRSP